MGNYYIDLGFFMEFMAKFSSVKFTYAFLFLMEYIERVLDYTDKFWILKQFPDIDRKFRDILHMTKLSLINV